MKELTLNCCPGIKSNDELGNNLMLGLANITAAAVMAVLCQCELGKRTV